MEMDSLRDDVTAEIAGFGARHYSRADAGSFDHEMTVLNSRIAVASMGLERELAGL
jgi:hypothetical protein